jgi:hypothetical protein
MLVHRETSGFGLGLARQMATKTAAADIPGEVLVELLTVLFLQFSQSGV